MGFSPCGKTLGSGKTFIQGSQPKLSVQIENITEASDAHNTEGFDGNINGFSL